MQSTEQTKSNIPIIGRFAPSPTGPLHFGSLIAAVASYLCARQHPQGQWLLRIEDVDTQRKQKGATNAIINALEKYGFTWDGEITYQSQRSAYYEEALAQLSQISYPCSCSRKDLQASVNPNNFSYVYPGNCQNGMQNPELKTPSIRLKTTDEELCFQDGIQPELFCQNIKHEIGDFIIKRRDGLFAYQLAVVVDDHLQNVNQIVRGADLYDKTPRQIYLQHLLGYNTADYYHFPVAVSSNGKKLSKQNGAPEITVKNEKKMLDNLIKAMEFLGQSPPKANTFSNLETFWQWAIVNWSTTKISTTMNVLYAENHNCDESN